VRFSMTPTAPIRQRKRHGSWIPIWKSTMYMRVPYPAQTRTRVNPSGAKTTLHISRTSMSICHCIPTYAIRTAATTSGRTRPQSAEAAAQDVWNLTTHPSLSTDLHTASHLASHQAISHLPTQADPNSVSGPHQTPAWNVILAAPPSP
jgi:hypothetical protein